ncbi:MAG: hypothetical protein OXU88_04320 [Gammaproteobacteria bacterium]|nr:hypothetical protein [Gammaproteobacteria bacterium]
MTMNDDTADALPTVRQIESALNLLAKAGFDGATESELINVLAGVTRQDMHTLIDGLKTGAITGLAAWRLDDIVDWLLNGERRETL